MSRLVFLLLLCVISNRLLKAQTEGGTSATFQHESETNTTIQMQNQKGETTVSMHTQKISNKPTEKPTDSTKMAETTNTNLEEAGLTSQKTSPKETSYKSTTISLTSETLNNTIMFELSSIDDTEMTSVLGSGASSSAPGFTREAFTEATTITTQDRAIRSRTSVLEKTTVSSQGTSVGLEILDTSTETTILHNATDILSETGDQTTTESINISSRSMDNVTSESITVTFQDSNTNGTEQTTLRSSSEIMTTDSSLSFMTINETSLLTSESDLFNHSSVTTTLDTETGSHSTESVSSSPEHTTSSTTKYTEMDETSSGPTTVVSESTSVEADSPVFRSATYMVHFSGDCNDFALQKDKDLFIRRVIAMFSQKLQIIKEYIKVSDIKCGSVYFNVTFERLTNADTDTLMHELLDANTTIGIEIDNNTLYFQFVDLSVISRTEDVSQSTKTDETTITPEERTTLSDRMNGIEFILKFTGDCQKLISKTSNENDTADLEITETSAEGSNQATKVFTIGETAQSSTEINLLSTDNNVDNTSPITDLSTTSGTKSVMSTMSTVQITEQNNTNGLHEASNSTENSESDTQETTEYTRNPNESSSTSQESDNPTMAVSTVSMQADETITRSSSVSQNAMETSTVIVQNDFVSRYSNFSKEEQFKAFLHFELAQALNTSQNDILIGIVSCGSVLINVTFINVEDMNELQKQVLALPDQSQEVTIVVEDLLYKLTDVFIPQEKHQDLTTEKPLDDDEKEEDGLTEIELIVIIICGVIGGGLLLTLLVFAIYRCCLTRNRKSFALGDTPTQMDLEDFTLTKMTRPSPVYTDHGVVYTNRSKQASPYNNPIQNSNNGHFDNHTASAMASQSGGHMRMSRENLVPDRGGPRVVSGVENPSFSSDDLLDSGSNTSMDLPYDGKVELNVGGENSKLV